jgi:GH25 family lysozyme M1 (1,4-beta-N-acetylmuramidase)
MLRIFIPLLCLLPWLTSCSTSDYGKVSYSSAPQVINVSDWDPKEKQKSGRSYSPSDQSSLKANGAQALIARCAKGPYIDRKCADFLVGAERQGMMLGTYYYVLPGESASRQADRYLGRLRSIKSSRGLRTSKVLLVADFDTNCSAALMAGFVSEIHQRTGVHPVVYLENSSVIRNTLRYASPSQKTKLGRCPYWLALYSDKNTGLETPLKLAHASGIWHDWAMWQYGGVFWQGGRSKIHHYQAGNWKTPAYFGNLDRPIERSGFNGSVSQLHSFWNKHSWAW